MDHPNIAKVLDAGRHRHRPALLRHGIGARHPHHRVLRPEPSEHPGTAGFVHPVCHAIQHAHQKGIIHRDIKPSNILVTLHDGVPVPKVIDFGIAKATEGRLTGQDGFHATCDQFIGTPAYMSPEQAEMSGLDIDTRSDIYSLGVLLYELLTGQHAFRCARNCCQARSGRDAADHPGGGTAAAEHAAEHVDAEALSADRHQRRQPNALRAAAI